MVLKFNKELYPKEAIIKTAFFFTDRAYIHLDIENNYYIVNLTSKGNIDSSDIENEFKNELLNQTARIKILRKTKDLREIIMVRDLAPSVAGGSNNYLKDSSNQPEINLNNLDNILEDWFRKNEYN